VLFDISNDTNYDANKYVFEPTATDTSRSSTIQLTSSRMTSAGGSLPFWVKLDS